MNVSDTQSAEDIIRELSLQPHPEGGHYAEIYRDSPADGSRGVATSIYFLLTAGEVSAWHTVDAVELYHYYAGAPLALSLSADGEASETVKLGPDVVHGERPLAIVPAEVWQSARSTGQWTLVGCTVAPAFEFAGFKMAPPDWAPGVG
jgi:predicted cupin superfamily sugar epimerase